MKSNLTVYNETKDRVKINAADSARIEGFDNYFIGALSSLCDKEQWEKALATAERLAVRP